MLVLQKYTAPDTGECDTDVDLVCFFYRRMARRSQWKDRFDRFTVRGLFDAVQFIGYENLSYEQTVYVARRFSNAVHDVEERQSRLKMQTTHAFVIYWLVMRSDQNTPIYVGQTQDIGRRWSAHRVGGKQTHGIRDLKGLEIKVVETVCGTIQDALEAETRHIEQALLLNPRLLNKRLR